MSSGVLLEKYKKLVRKLWPKGRAWENVLSSDVGEKLITALAKEPCRIDERITDLITELDPLTSSELLEDWETLLGLPDECAPEGQTLDERRQQARQRLADQGGQSAIFLETATTQLGFPGVEISDILPFRVGLSTVGESLTNGFSNPFLVGQSRVGDVLLNEGWRFYFEVNSPVGVVDPFEVGIDTVGEPLVVFGDELLECTIRKLKPAHTAPFFTFS